MLVRNTKTKKIRNHLLKNMKPIIGNNNRFHFLKISGFRQYKFSYGIKISIDIEISPSYEFRRFYRVRNRNYIVRTELMSLIHTRLNYFYNNLGNHNIEIDKIKWLNS